MNSDFYNTLKRVRFRSAQFPDAISKLDSEYNNLLLILRKYQLENPETLMKFCIHAYNQITKEQAKIVEWNKFLWQKDLKKLTKDEIAKHQIELDYYSGILSITYDARAILLEHIAAYAPEKITPSLEQELKNLLPFSPVALTFKPVSTTKMTTKKNADVNEVEIFENESNEALFLKKLKLTSFDEVLEMFYNKVNYEKRRWEEDEILNRKQFFSETQFKQKVTGLADAIFDQIQSQDFPFKYNDDILGDSNKWLLEISTVLPQLTWDWTAAQVTQLMINNINRKVLFEKLKYLKNELSSPQPPEAKTVKLRVPQIALIHAYEEIQITMDNATEIAAKYGYTAKTSGKGLYDDYLKYLNSNDRKAKPTAGTKKTLKNKIELFESVVNRLSDNAKKRANDEIKILKAIFEKEYQ